VALGLALGWWRRRVFNYVVSLDRARRIINVTLVLHNYRRVERGLIDVDDLILASSRWLRRHNSLTSAQSTLCGRSKRSIAGGLVKEHGPRKYYQIL
jgi:hypothetical protein